MSLEVSVDKLPQALQQTLSRYVFVLSKEIDVASSQAMKKLVSISKEEAPRSDIEKPNHFSRYITSKHLPGPIGFSRYLWYVREPYAGLGVILQWGHLVISHGRNTGYYANRKINFLGRSVRKVRGEYEARLQEIVERAGK